MIELDPVCLTAPAVHGLESLKLQILDAIRIHGPMTDNQLYDLFPNRLQGTVRARRIELTRDARLIPIRTDSYGRTVWAFPTHRETI